MILLGRAARCSVRSTCSVCTVLAALLFLGSSTLSDAGVLDGEKFGELSDEEKRILKSRVTIIPYDTTGEMKVDGVLDEPFWTNATHLTLRFETHPAPFAEAPVKTEAWLLRLNDAVVVGFKAEDPNPEEISAPLRDRDGIELDDYVGFVFDPEGKRLRTYEFYVSASGVQGDWIRNQVDDTRARDWDAHWESAAVVSTNGYSVEMRIPFTEMDIPLEEGLKRLLVFKRHYPRKVRHYLGAFGVIEPDLDTIRNVERSLLFVPQLSYVTDRTRTPPSDKDWSTEDEAEFSVDLEYRFTTSFGAVATFNPNYLEVEADLTESSINDSFTRLLPEKRAFFNKGSEVFGTPFDLVYTRNIIDPRYGFKVGGSMDDFTTGDFFSEDQDLSVIVPGNLSSERVTLEGAENFSGAFRTRYDIKEGLAAGAISTLRLGESDYRNVTAGGDVYAKLGPEHALRAQWVYSDSEYPDEFSLALEESVSTNADVDVDSGMPGETRYNEQVLRALPDRTYQDDAWQLLYKYKQRGGFITARYLDAGQDFRADLGYLPRVDYRQGLLSAGKDHYVDRPGKGHTRWRLSGNVMRQETQDGEVFNDTREVWLNYWGLVQSWFRIGYRDRDRIARRFQQDTLAIDGNAPEFNEDQWLFRAETSPVQNGRLILAGRLGEQIDTDNYRLGDLVELEPELRWTVADRYELALKSTYRQLDVDDGRVFTENYLTLNLTYQLKKGSFFRFTLIDDYLKRDNDLYLFDEVDHLERDTSGELLFAWKPTQRNVFFIGVRANLTDGDELDRHELDETRFYVKYARAWTLGGGE